MALAGLVVTLVMVAQAGGAPAAAPAQALVPEPAPLTGPAPGVPPDALRFEELPGPPAPPSDDARVKRFLGALAGGAVGLGGTLAFLPLGDAPCGGGFFFGACFTFAHGLFSGLAPVMGLTGAWLGYLLSGGDAGAITPYAAVLPASLLGLALTALASAAGVQSMLGLMPYLITSGAVLVGAAALALDARAQQLDALGGARDWGSASAGRVAVTALISAVTVTGGVLGTALGAAACVGNGVCMVAVIGLLGVGATLAASAAAWGVHRAMRGRGSFGAALLGLSLAVGASLLGLPALLASTSNFSLSVPVGAISGFVYAPVVLLGGLFGSALALEWSHSEATRESLPRVSVGAAPAPGGGAVSVTVRL